MRAEALARHDLVFIDHHQRAEADVARVVVMPERETVTGVEPAMIGDTTFFTTADFLHAILLDLIFDIVDNRESVG
jgi:hypothetical protein